MIGFRTTAEIKELIQKLAFKENRTVSNWLENALLTYLREHENVNVDELRKKND